MNSLSPSLSRLTPILVLLFLVAAGTVAPFADAAAPAAPTVDDYGDLVALFEQIQPLRRAELRDGVPDYSPATIAQRAEQLAALSGRLREIDPSTWPVSGQIDYLLVRAQLAAVDFELRVVRPWARDPGLVVDLVRRAAYAEIPARSEQVDAFRARLAAVPRLVEAARTWLTRPSAELAGMAMRQLSRSDGVNQGEPRRPVPPEGVIGWYEDLLGRAEAAGGELTPDVRAALDAVRGYHDWLEASRELMDEPASVGLEHYDWYLRNVLLMPFDSEALLTLAEREKARARTFLMIERHRNRGLPEIEPAATAQEHAERVEQAEALIREFMDGRGLVTIPEGLPERFETDAYWIVRNGGKRHFWEEITYRDPLNNHIHASIPGHRFDGLVQRANANPIRSRYRDGVRSEGWAFYIEEMFLQAGILDERPRAKELFYIAQLKRAARVPAELAMQTGAIDLAGAIDYLVEQVPLMEEDLARYDLAIYLRRPTYGMNYVMGKIQLEALLSDRAQQLGEEFDLGAFHDQLLAAGPIPFSLIRWEMTGMEDEIAGLW